MLQPKIGILDHVAIAVRDLERSKKIYELLGLEFEKDEEIVIDQGVKTAFAQIDQNAHLELVTPHGEEEKAIHKFLNKNGEGIHHICFLVENLQYAMDNLTSEGYRVLYEKPQIGAKGRLVNFIHPKSAGGVLIELSQKED